LEENVMKKKVVLLLVIGLAIASQAGAQIGEEGDEIYLTVNGQDNVYDITVNVGDTLTIGVWSNIMYAPGSASSGNNHIWRLEAKDASTGGPAGPLAKFTGYSLIEPSWTSSPLDLIDQNGNTTTPDILRFRWIKASAGGEDPPVITRTGQWYDATFLCTGLGDVQIKIGDWGTTPPVWSQYDYTITVHQIPEPMTLMLLGLGGIPMLRRRVR
jgi:hypothetical protein